MIIDGITDSTGTGLKDGLIERGGLSDAGIDAPNSLL